MHQLIVDEGGDPTGLQVQGNVRVAAALPEQANERQAYLEELVTTFREAAAG